MSYKRFTYLAVFIGTFALAWPALPVAPQFTVQSAHYMFNANSQNWNCDHPLSDPQGNCHSQYPPASYTFMHHVYPTETTPGNFIAVVDGGARDGGFEPEVGDNISTFFLNGPQGGTHTLGQTQIEADGQIGCVPETGSSCHWEPDDTLYYSETGHTFLMQEVWTSGDIGTAVGNWFLLGASANGISDWTWYEVLRSDRPGGKGTGSLHTFNRFHVVRDPGNPYRLIGLMTWHYNNGTTSTSGTTPFYLDVLLPGLRIGILFANEGWCEMPWGQRWTSFNPAHTCADLQDGGTGALPDFLYDMGIGVNNEDLALVDGKPLVLQSTTASGTSNQRCDNYPNYIDPGTGNPFPSEAACAYAHAPCPPGTDPYLYVQRRNELEFAGKRSWSVRELSLNTWNTAYAAHSWNGGARAILDGNQGLQFKIEPTDLKSTGEYHGGMLTQLSDGRVYMYLSIKHSLCLPNETGLQGAFRFPKTRSGTSVMWLRLR